MAGPDVGVYVHVPFCERVCPYCDFAVVAARPLAAETAAGYVEALLSELARRREDFAGHRLATLYLGGGTPSLLDPALVGRIVAGVTAAFGGAPAGEVTLEVNPSTVERERLPGFRAAGVDRVSVGVQSFDDETLRRLGRAHRGVEAHRTLEACRQAGFPQVSLDLIFGAPHQTAARLEGDLAAALDHAPDHVSTYELTVEEGTPFATAAARGQLAVPEEALAVAMLESVETRLVDAGFTRYELSNYARPDCEARHNRRYWERLPVLGLGVGAFSTDPATASHPFGTRRVNPRALNAYLAAVARGEPPDTEVLDAATARGEATFLGLRTARGVDGARFAAEFGELPRRFYGEVIDALQEQGLLAEAPSGDLRLTPRGRLLSDTVFAHFV